MSTPPQQPQEQPPWSPAWQAPLPPPPPQPVAPDGRPLATFGDRFLAYLIDYALYFVLTLVLFAPFMIWWVIHIVTWAQENANNTTLEAADFLRLYLPIFVFVPVSLVVAALFTYLYFVEYQLSNGGQTLGKKMIKIRVIRVEPGAPLERRNLLYRWGVQWVVAMFVPVFSYVDGLWQLGDKPLQQCLHDKAASTVVIKVG